MTRKIPKMAIAIMLLATLALAQTPADKRQAFVNDMNRGNAAAGEYHFAADGPAKTTLLVVILKPTTPGECKQTYGSQVEPNPRNPSEFSDFKNLGFTRYGIKCTTAQWKSYVYSIDLTAPGQSPHFTPEPPPDAPQRTDTNNSTLTARGRLIEAQQHMDQGYASLDFFDAKDSLLKTPIKPFAFTRGEIPFDFDARPEMFDPAKAGQEAESIDLGLRNMVRNRASDTELRLAVDQLVRWARKMERLQAQYYTGGLAALDALAERSPRDSKVLARCATRWVDAVEVERMEVLVPVEPVWRGDSNLAADVRVDPQTYLWRYPRASPYATNGPVTSAAFPRAQRAIQRALSVDPHNPEALFASAMLSRRQYGAVDDVVLSALQQASQSTGSYASAARVYVLQMDRSYTSGLTARIDKLREVIRGPSTGGGRTESFVGSYTPGQSVDPGQVVRGSSVYRVNGGASSVPGPILKAPTPQELAEANSLEAQIAQYYRQSRQQIDSLVRREPANPEMFAVLSTTYHGGTIGERIIRYALMLNPGDYRLYWLRVTALAKGGNWLGGNEQLGPHNIAEASDYSQWALRKGLANDLQRCLGMASETHNKYNDPFTYYELSVRCVNMEPDHPGPRRALVVSLAGMVEPTIVGSEMPDGLEQGQMEAEVMYQIAARRLDHPDEWAPDDSKTIMVRMMALAKFFRGYNLHLLHRDQEARPYLLQSVNLDPAATSAQRVLDQISNPRPTGR